MCICIPEGQQYSGLDQENHNQRGLREIFLPLYSALMRPPPVELSPVVGSPAQEGHQAVGVGPEVGHKNYQRAGTPPLWVQAKEAGVSRPGEGSSVS